MRQMFISPSSMLTSHGAGGICQALAASLEFLARSLQRFGPSDIETGLLVPGEAQRSKCKAGRRNIISQGIVTKDFEDDGPQLCWEIYNIMELLIYPSIYSQVFGPTFHLLSVKCMGP